MKKNLKIAVTGAGGFLGRSTVEHLVKSPNISELRVLYAHPDPVHAPSEKIRTFVGELSEKETAIDLVHGADAVVHLANRGTYSSVVLNPTSYLRQELVGTGILLEAMVHEKVSRIFYTSSGSSVYKYDPVRKVPFHEGSELEFRSAFALLKLTSEQVLQHYKKVHGISPVILRLSNPFGKHQLENPLDGFIGNAFLKALQNEELKILGNLDAVKDFIYIDDFLRVIEGFLQHPEQQGIFNVASGMGVSLREVVTNVERLTGRKMRLSFSGFSPSDTPWAVLNTSKLQRAISWTCRHSIQDGLRLTWDLLQSDARDREKRSAA